VKKHFIINIVSFDDVVLLIKKTIIDLSYFIELGYYYYNIYIYIYIYIYREGEREAKFKIYFECLT
jgi:hypothetical protein